MEFVEEDIFYKKGQFCIEKGIFYENNKRIGYVDKEYLGYYTDVVNRLCELLDLNIDLKRENKKLREENEKLKRVCNR